MFLVYRCEYCGRTGTMEEVQEHEVHCDKNPSVIKEREEQVRRNRFIMNHCGYHTTAFDDGCYEFDACNRRGCGYGRHADECHPDEECLLK